MSMQKRASLFKCPVCSKPLLQEEKQYRCENGHNYDISRKGYVNLLFRKNKGPGDTKEMLGSRREFLNKGYYKIFSDAINKVVLDDLTDVKLSDLTGKTKKREINILDAGCGEGYYLRRLNDELITAMGTAGINLYGIDVSKPAVHLAAGGDKRIHFAVGSTYHIPLLSNSLDYILCIFSPRDEAEFLRVLKPGGKLIVAAPGPRHLFGLKMALYQDSEVIGQKGTVGEGFRLTDEIHVTYTLTLNSTEDILNLLTMTPYVRHTDEDMVENLRKLNLLSTEVDFNIFVYQRN